MGLGATLARIYVGEDARRHDLTTASAYDRLAVADADLGYAVTVLPKIPVAARADLCWRRPPLPDARRDYAKSPKTKVQLPGPASWRSFLIKAPEDTAP